MSKIADYAMAVATWVASGRPRRTDEQVENILAVCAPCEHFTGKACNLCGCRLSLSKSALDNKARMATEFCPVGKW